MYELAKFEDPLGQFEMHCATPEMTLIHLMDATKKNVEKHLPEQEMDKIFEQLQLKYGSKASTLAALETTPRQPRKPMNSSASSSTSSLSGGAAENEMR